MKGQPKKWFATISAKQTEIYFYKLKRASIYKGVAKNGEKWQIMFMANGFKVYRALDTEQEAAQDYHSLRIPGKGINSKTNFSYRLHHLKAIVSSVLDNSQEIE